MTKKKRDTLYTWLTGFLLTVFLSLLFVGEVQASTRQEQSTSSMSTTKSSYVAPLKSRGAINLEKIYLNAVAKGAISESSLSFDTWSSMEQKDLWPTYQNNEKQGFIPRTQTYEEWLKNNNYGAIKGLDDNPNVQRVLETNSTADNRASFVNTVRKGDLLIVQDAHNIWNSFIGHAAIATTDNYILDMPGYKNGAAPQNDNNRQTLKGNWFDDYSASWTYVYRLTISKSIVNNIADWADWRFYSSTHSATKDRHVRYSLATELKGDFSTAYCSKLVWDALYYGSGDFPLMTPTVSYTIISPLNLIGSMDYSYTPTNLGKF